MIVAVAQGKALGVFGGVGAEPGNVIQAMHGQRGFVGPENALVDLGENHPIGQSGNDLLQLAAIGFLGENGLAHGFSKMAT